MRGGTKRGQKTARAGEEGHEEHDALRRQKPPPPRAFFRLYDEEDAEWEARPGSVTDPRPQERVQRHTVERIIETFVPVPMLDVPVPLMVEQLVDVLQFFDTFLPVVAEQVIDVPKIIFEDIPTRTPLCEPQLVEQLAEVPTEHVFVEQTVDIPVPGGGGRLADLQGFLPEQSSTACGCGRLQGFLRLRGFSPQQRHPHFFALQSMRSTLRMSRLTGFFALFPGLKKCEDRRAVECEAGCAHELIHAERSSNGSRRCGYHLG